MKRKRGPVTYQRNVRPYAFSAPSSRSLKPYNYEKKVISVFKSSVGTSQVVSNLLTADGACTIKGVRWTLCFARVGTTTDAKGSYVIVKVPEGRSANDINNQGALSDNATYFYVPPENVIGLGHWGIDSNFENTVIHIKHSRKHIEMKEGDRIQIIMRGISDQTQINGTVQLFCLE